MIVLTLTALAILIVYLVGKPFIAYIETHPEDDSDLKQKEL